MDRYRDRDRRSPERDRSRYAAPTDSYVPASSRSARPRSRSSGRYRPRSRTPSRVQADTWRGRPRSRSPVLRSHEGRVDAYPSREGRLRSPRRDYPFEGRYEEDRRLARVRSPQTLKRSRQPSPLGRGERSPPPVKRERISSPARDYARPRSPPRRGYPSPPSAFRSDYRQRSKTPPRRDDRSDQYAARSYRRASPSPRPAKVEPRSTEESGRESVGTSRRSSPRGQPRRFDKYEDSRSQGLPYRRSPRARSPLPIRVSQREEEHNAAGSDSRSRHFREVDVPMSPDQYASSREFITPADPAARKDSRGAPTGPAASSRYVAPAAAPIPLGPAAAPVSMSAHNRLFHNAPPAYPRGPSYRGRGGPPMPRDYPAREFASSISPTRGGRGGWGSTTSYGRGAQARDDGSSHDIHQQDSRSGPPSHSRDFPHPPPPGFRGSNNSTSTTYPRTQRFNVPAASVHLADLPTINTGGERLSPLHDMSKAERLEEEAARLRKMIDEKQEQKRQALREWENLERQSKTAGLRTELAEENLRNLSEDTSGLGVGGVAAF